ncbi:hypothetical protein PIB30_050412 [Stylosanthes scabra]|uniref:Uncharacterized protein n=1 Tax=Stylosanthes scabra TaxID=79078 RepID=A0ABU6WHG2_9FABA|nr:hypothetical protein [Stylosanthes scabra]
MTGCLLIQHMHIVQTETVQEKRRRAVHLLKQGLEVSHDDDDEPKKADFPHGIEPETEEIHLAQDVEENGIIEFQLTRTEREVSNTTSLALESSQEIIPANESITKPVAKIPIEKQLEEIRSTCLASCSTNGIGSTKSKMKSKMQSMN